MATISAGFAAVPSVSPAPDPSRVMQARRDAEQAQTKANALRQQADSMDRVARSSQDYANNLSNRSKQLDATYERQLRGSSQSIGRLLNTSA